VTFLVVAWRTNLRWGFSSSSFDSTGGLNGIPGKH
jgi:hypothetical protein